MGSATTAVRKVVSSSTLFGPFKIWARAQIQRPLAFAFKFKWANQSWGWNHLASSCCRGPHHKNFRKTEEANCRANFSFFTSPSTAKAHGFGVKFIELYGAVDFIAIRHHITGSSVQLMEVTCFFKLTSDHVLVFDWIAGSYQELGQDRANYCALIVIVQPCMMKRRRRQVELFSVLHRVTQNLTCELPQFSHSS